MIPAITDISKRQMMPASQLAINAAVCTDFIERGNWKDTGKVDIIALVPFQVAQKIFSTLNRLEYLLAAAFVSVKWNKVLSNQQAWSRVRFSKYHKEIWTLESFNKIHQTIQFLGSLFAPGKINPPAERVDLHRDNPFLYVSRLNYFNREGDIRSPEQLREIGISVAIRLVTLYRDYTLINYYSADREIVWRLDKRKLSSHFKLDFLEVKFFECVRYDDSREALECYKRIIDSNPSFRFNRLRCIYMRQLYDCIVLMGFDAESDPTMKPYYKRLVADLHQ